jgi:hypothetical protein
MLVIMMKKMDGPKDSPSIVGCFINVGLSMTIFVWFALKKGRNVGI